MLRIAQGSRVATRSPQQALERGVLPDQTSRSVLLRHGFYRGEFASSIVLHDGLGQVMDSRREADSVVLGIVDRVEELHEGVAQDVHVLESGLIDIQLGDVGLANASFGTLRIDSAGDPVMRRKVVVNSVDDVGEVWEH